MDINGLISILEKIQNDEIKITCCDLVSPSPLSQEVISAKPYAFLDDGDAEERRTMAIKTQRHMTVNDASELSKLDPAAIQKVREEAWPLVRTADELHDGLMLLGFIMPDEVNKTESTDKKDLVANMGWQHLFDELVSASRATCITPKNGEPLWIAAERLHEYKQLFPDAKIDHEIKPVYEGDSTLQDEDVLLEIIRSRLEGTGPVTALQLAQPLGLNESSINQVLLNLEQEGFVVQGQFSKQDQETNEWCERRLLARIHRYTISRLRSEIEPVSLSNYMRFLFNWQGIGQNEDEKGEGIEALAFRLQQLEGYSVAASAWESEILPARIKLYTADLLENLCVSGRFSWLRLNVASSPANKKQKKKSPVSLSPITLIQRQNIPYWQQLASSPSSSEKNEADEQTLSPYADKIKQTLESRGALFFNDIVMQTGILKTQVEEALGELVNWGLVTSDGFNGIRALIMPQTKRKRSTLRRARGMGLSPFDNAGRWSLIHSTANIDDIDSVEFIAHTLLKRYGVVFRKVLQRETNLPPWRDLLRVYWRMEARGEIRGGRFVNGVSGEQFATTGCIEHT
ncbi:putative ATP-dependent helicase lhr [Nymphon striatum]|nr:putative ATP-dependent helicase lhr [Nymphon striatum]